MAAKRITSRRKSKSGRRSLRNRNYKRKKGMRGGDSIPKHAFELIMDVENEKDRYEDIKPLMEMLKITPTFVVNKDNVSSHPLYPKFKNQHPTAISLAINHIECIKKHKGTNEYLVIFESDATPLYDLEVVKRDIEKAIKEMQDNKIDFVFMGKGHLKDVSASAKENITETLYKMSERASRCAESYIISPNGITRYLEYLDKEPEHSSIDWDYNYFFVKNPDIVVAWRIPELFRQNTEKFKSTVVHS
jgi:hypothetical protein